VNLSEAIAKIEQCKDEFELHRNSGVWEVYRSGDERIIGKSPDLAQAIEQAFKFIKKETMQVERLYAAWPDYAKRHNRPSDTHIFYSDWIGAWVATVNGNQIKIGNDPVKALEYLKNG
jgi:hypothetical protein